VPKSMSMSLDDYNAIKLMIRKGALQPIEPAKLPKLGYIKVACPDGDNTPEMLKHFHYGVCVHANGGDTVCTHLAPVTGGPGTIPEISPMHQILYKGQPICTADKMVYSFIEQALAVKGDRVPNMTLVPHAPCGMATLRGLSVWENFYLTFLAKDLIRKEFPHTFESIKVTPHINFIGYEEAKKPSGSFRTYLLRRSDFEALYDHREYRRRA
jgi:hypothetical protein